MPTGRLEHGIEVEFLVCFLPKLPFSLACEG